MQPRSERYEIQRPVEFRVRNGTQALQGQGRTVNISRGGLLFETQERLRVGDTIDCVIQMGPGLSDSKKTVTLQVQGITLRNEDGRIAVSIKRHSLRPGQPSLKTGIPL